MWRSTPSGHQQALFWAWRPYPRAQDRGVKAAQFFSKSSALITKRPVILVSFRPRSQNPSVRFRLVQEIPWHGAAPRQKRCKCFIESHGNFPIDIANNTACVSETRTFLAFVTYLIQCSDIWLSCWQCRCAVFAGLVRIIRPLG